MPYLEIRGRRRSGKTSLALLLASHWECVFVAPTQKMAEDAERLACEMGITLPVCFLGAPSFDELLGILLGQRMITLIVDEAQAIQSAKNKKWWGRGLRQNLKRLACRTGGFVVAIFGERG